MLSKKEEQGTQNNSGRELFKYAESTSEMKERFRDIGETEDTTETNDDDAREKD